MTAPAAALRPRSRHLPTALSATAALALLALFAAPVHAAVPEATLFEGVLTSVGGGPVADGPYKVTFALYAAASGGSAVWSEGPVDLNIVGGRLSYRLGSSKPLTAATLAALDAAWIGVAVGGDPELQRQQLASAPYALHAASAKVAEGIACSNCLSASAAAFNYAASATKGGPAIDVDCTGCVSVAELKFDADVDLGGNSLKGKNGTFSGDVVAKTITAASFVGDGSKLTGIVIPSGTCSKDGEVVKGIKADGSLICASSGSSLPGDGISAISNGVMSNVFIDTFATPAPNLAIPDNTGSAATQNIDVPDLGLVRDLKIAVSVKNTDLSKVAITVLPPDDKAKGYVLCDPCGKADEKDLKVTYDVKNPPKSGDLAAEIGKNVKGLWTIKVLDSDFCVPQKPGNAALCSVANKTDGLLVDWSIAIETLSNSKVQNPAGHLFARVATASAEALGGGKSLDVDTKSGTPALVAQAWIYDANKKVWLQAATGASTLANCTSCGSGKDGDYKPGASANLAAKTYEFKDFIIPQGITITVTGSAPLIIKATGKVEIAGVLDLRGEKGASTSPSQNGCSGNTGCAAGGAAGAGGSAGAKGCYGNSGETGGGSGGGKGATYCSSYGAGGGGAGYGSNGSGGVPGASSCTPGGGGSAYNGVHQGTLVGGSGGGSGSYGTASNAGGAGGGGGGGAIRIDAASITVSGQLLADGGAGGDQTNNCDGGAGGGGSGGGVWLRAPEVKITGKVSAVGGAAGDAIAGHSSDGGDGGAGGAGQIQIDTISPIVGTTNPAHKAGNAADLGTSLNSFVLEQPSAGLVRLTNTSPTAQKVQLVVTY